MSLKNKTRLHRYILYSLWFLIFTALQESVFTRFPLLGASPLMAPLFTASVAMLDKSRDSLIFGLCAGIITDCLTGMWGFYTFTLCAACPLFIRLVSDAVDSRKAVVYVLGGIFCLTEHVLLALILMFVRGGEGSLTLWQCTFPQLLYTMLLGLPLLFILFRVDARFDRFTRHRR